MPWLLAAVVTLSTATAVDLSTGAAVDLSTAPAAAAEACPGGDPLALIARGEPWKAEQWVDCRRRCAKNRDCAVFEAPCGTWAFAHKGFRREFEAYQAALRRGAECPEAKKTARPSAACHTGVCGPVAGSCEDERGAFRDWALTLPRACADDRDCELYYIDPEPCRPPYVLQRGIDLRKDEAKLAAFRERVSWACGHALRPPPACSPPLAPFECANGFCRPALP